jgi:dihydrofolate synthase/folylpolyglutamate synthase
VSDNTDPVLARLTSLHPRLMDLSLDRLRGLLAKLGNPERRLPPVIHVAGTNGKGSTCAFLRAIGEAAGWRVHVFTSPHLVRFNERFRIAGRIVSDDVLTATMAHIEAVNANEPITLFEVITAAAFHMFAQVPAEHCVLEVGLGGRGDATNVIPPPAATAIASISLDHKELLGDTLAAIAAEKAGIMKQGVPVAIGTQPPEVTGVLLDHAGRAGAPSHLHGQDWFIEPLPSGFRYRDRFGSLTLPAPGLPGLHQMDNAGIAIAALRASGLPIPEPAFAAGIAAAEWPARLQRMRGRLAALLPADWELWLDGGHNPGAGKALAEHLRGWGDRPVHVVVGLNQAKDGAGFLRPVVPHATTLWAIREESQHAAMAVADVIAASGGVARPGPTLVKALRALPRATGPARVLICGSLYLAGEVLKADGTS